jgi:hypothetical protein
MCSSTCCTAAQALLLNVNVLLQVFSGVACGGWPAAADADGGRGAAAHVVLPVQLCCSMQPNVLLQVFVESLVVGGPRQLMLMEGACSSTCCTAAQVVLTNAADCTAAGVCGVACGGWPAAAYADGGRGAARALQGGAACSTHRQDSLPAVQEDRSLVRMTRL